MTPPIYDSDWTTSYEIGKLYDNDGTANYQIGRVYDNDGTSNYLIYQSEEEMLSAFSASDYYHPNGAYQPASINTDGSLQFNATSNLLRNIWTPAVDLSQWNLLTVTYTVTASAAAAGYSSNRGITIMANATNTMSWSIDSPGTTYSAYFKFVYGNDQVPPEKPIRRRLIFQHGPAA